MEDSKLYSLEEVLVKGIEVTTGNETKAIKISGVLIPCIQRAYAQGRKNEETVRKNILNSIFSILEGDEIKESDFGFIYGSTIQDTKQDTERLVLIDGQQRFTTIFLIYWYILSRENGVLPDYMRHFMYETRTTSTDFIHNITDKDDPIVLSEGKKPSGIINDLIWMTEDYRCDATVVEMMNMLDAIHKKYTECGKSGLSEKLKDLQFYVLLLEQFGLSEDLYIKMNARGLRLTPFENFKADLLNCIKEAGIKDVEYKDSVMPYDIIFSIKIDTIWVDNFWKKAELIPENNEDQLFERDKRYNIRFINFFARYFAYKSYVNDKDELIDFFIKKSETEQEKEYLGFECYKDIIEKVGAEELFKDFERVLDVLTYMTKNRKDDLDRLLCNPWDDNDRFDICTPIDKKMFEGEKNDFTLANRTVLMGLFAFIEKMKDSEISDTIFEQMKIWMRFVWKMVVYRYPVTRIDNNPIVKQLTQLFCKIINSGDTAVFDINKVLSSFRVEEDEYKTVVETIILAESIKQAKIVVSNRTNNRDQGFTELFKEIEGYGFSRGIGGYFISESDSLDVAKNKFYKYKTMFSEECISQEFQKDCLLLRAFMSQLNQWGDMKDFMISQSNPLYIRAKIAVNSKIREFISNAVCKDDIESFLIQTIEDARPNLPRDEKQGQGFYLAYYRLVKEQYSAELLQWMIDNSDDHRRFTIVKPGFNYIARLDYQGIYVDLDTDRHLMLSDLKDKYGYNIDSVNFVEEKAGHFVTNWDAWAMKEIQDKSCRICHLHLKFSQYTQSRNMYFIVDVNEEDKNNPQRRDRLQTYLRNNGRESYIQNDGTLQLGGFTYLGKYDERFPELLKEINVVEDLLKGFEG